jgi:hypothetical protein
MVVVIAGYGHLYQSFKIIPPAIAHFTFDVILLWNLRRKNENSTFNNEIEQV